MVTFQQLGALSCEDFSEQLQRNRVIWLFHHIPKTAGTSLVQELRFCFPPYFNIGAAARRAGADAGPGGDPLSLGIELCLQQHPQTQFRAISGHLWPHHVTRLLEALPQVRAFTVLRDPVRRMVSEYRYMRTPRHPGHAGFIARYPDLDSYLDDPANANKMWRSLARDGERPDAAGLAQVFGRYTFIGTLEDYALSLEFLTALTGHPKTPGIRANVTESTAGNEVAITDALHARLVAANQDDIALHQAVTARLADNRARMLDFIARRRALYDGAADPDRGLTGA